MRNPFKHNHLTINELVQWKQTPLINPKTGKAIKENGGTFQLIDSIYKKYKTQVDEIFNNKFPSSKSEETSLVIDSGFDSLQKIKINILNCIDDRDPISMNIFWKEIDGKKQIEYPEETLSQLIFYTDSKNLLRCLEKETLRYLKTYNLILHPITSEPIPSNLFDNLDVVDLNKLEEEKTVEDIALDVFQYFSKISIFINYEWFTQLKKDKLLKFNYEIKDFWLQNVSDSQKLVVSNNPVLSMSNDDLDSKSTEEIQRYLLEEIRNMLKCEKEEIKYMINYIILGALGIVIPKIKELYPDFAFGF